MRNNLIIFKIAFCLLYKCPEEHRFQVAGKEREKDWACMQLGEGGRGGRQIGRKKERKIRADNNNLGKGRDREEKTGTKRKKGLDTCKARVVPTCTS